MGRQVGFYMSPSDDVEFMEWIRSRSDVVLMDRCNPSLTPRVVRYLHDLSGGKGAPSGLLVNTSFPYWPSFQKVPDQDLYCPDLYNAGIVYVTATWRQGRFLRAGRLYVVTPDDPGEVREFSRWFDSLVRYIRANYVKTSAAYMGPGAANLVSAEGLELG